MPLRALTRRKEFLQALAPSLRGVPTMTVRHPRRGRTSSGRLLPRLGKLAGAGLLVLIFGTVGVLAYHQDTSPAWSEQIMWWTETAELANGTEVTAREPVPEEVAGEVAVAVTVCGGTQSYGQDPEGEPVEEQAQNTVRPSDYTLRGENGVDLAQAPSAEPAARVLERGECLPLTLRFRGERGDQPVLVHTNSAGDEITWW